MEELLMEMKSDVSRLPSELGKITSVSTQLKMDEISTISKAAHKETAPVIVNNNSTGSGGNRPSTVITNSPEVVATITPTVVGGASTNVGGVISDRSKQLQSTQRSASPRHKRTAEEKVSVVAGSSAVATAVPATAAPVAYATSTGGTIQLSAGSLVQTPDGLVVYQGTPSSNAMGAQKTATVVQQTPVVTQSTNNAQTYAIGVPTYVDGSGGTAAAAVYLQGLQGLQGQTVQLVQVSGGGQQMVYWPPVVQGGQAVSTTQAGAQIAVLTTDANGAPVITID